MATEIQERVSIETLLTDGLNHYAARRLDDAVRAWNKVLELQPGEPRAIDYLDACGARFPDAEALTDPLIARVIPLTERVKLNTDGQRQKEVITLVSQKRYEEALDLLYVERAARPHDPSVDKAIRHLRDHLCLRYGAELGTLDRVLLRAEARPPETMEERAVLALVNDAATVDDLTTTSPLGRFRALRALSRLFGEPKPPSTAQPNLAAARPPAPAAARPVPSATPANASRRDPQPAAPTTTVRAVVPAAPSPRSPVPPRAAAPPADPFDAAFDAAMRAYLARRYDEALARFRDCLQLRPGDPRVSMNIARIESMHAKKT